MKTIIAFVLWIVAVTWVYAYQYTRPVTTYDEFRVNGNFSNGFDWFTWTNNVYGNPFQIAIATGAFTGSVTTNDVMLGSWAWSDVLVALNTKKGTVTTNIYDCSWSLLHSVTQTNSDRVLTAIGLFLPKFNKPCLKFEIVLSRTNKNRDSPVVEMIRVTH